MESDISVEDYNSNENKSELGNAVMPLGLFSDDSVLYNKNIYGGL
jgi:hypothetical protein